ncbi:glycosyltransferase [uncultured Friedmanniella sp.]|uniref:glycosyltransferase n=1 Tax=uncultured Friedmanniella sp. TaxID=335381 RepID=UPI0035C9B00F
MTATPAPRLRIFTETRLHRRPDGSVVVVDRSSGAEAWEPYRRRLGQVDLAARLSRSEAVDGVPVGPVAIHALPSYRGVPQLVRRLPRVLRAVLGATAAPDLCLFRLPGTISLVGASWCRLRRRRYAVEVVGDPADVLRSGVLGPAGTWLAPAVAAATRWAVAGAAAGRYVTARTLQGRYPLAPGAAEYHYSNVRLAAEDLTTGPRPARAVRRLVAVGTHDQLYKGHDDLIRAAALLAVRGVPVALSLVGDGRHHDELRQLARDCGVERLVTFHGRVNDRAALRELLDAADLFCMPSRTEGLPRALIEAMARGLPAVGTTVGGIPELLPPPWLVPPSDPGALAGLVGRFVDGSVDYAAASAQAWQRGQEFAPGPQAERVERWLAELDALAGLAIGST